MIRRKKEKRKYEKETKKSRIKIIMEIVGHVSAIVGILGIIVYIWASYYSDTKINFAMPGDTIGEPVVIPPSSELFIFAIETEKQREVEIEKVTIKYSPDDGVELLKDIQNTNYLSLTNDNAFPVALEFRDFAGNLVINNTHSCVLGFRYRIKPSTNKFKLKFEVISKLADWEFGFPFSMFSLSKRKVSRIVEFNPKGYGSVESGDQIRKYGLKIKPGRTVKGFGEAARVGYKAIGEDNSPPIPLKVYELFKE